MIVIVYCSYLLTAEHKLVYLRKFLAGLLFCLFPGPNLAINVWLIKY